MLFGGRNNTDIRSFCFNKKNYIFTLLLNFPWPLKAPFLQWQHANVSRPKPGSVQLVGCELLRMLCTCWFLLPTGSNGELRGSGSDRAGILVLGAAPAGAGGAEWAGQCRVGTGEMVPERRQCEFPDCSGGTLTHGMLYPCRSLFSVS